VASGRLEGSFLKRFNLAKKEANGKHGTDSEKKEGSKGCEERGAVSRRVKKRQDIVLQ